MSKTVAAGIFLVNKENKLLVCHPTNHKPTFWSIPKGKVEDGEYYLDAAIRETYEETNVKLTDCKRFITLEPMTYKHKKKVLYPFVVFETENYHIDFKKFDLKCNSFVPADRGGFPEMDAYQWVSLDEAKTMLHETQVECIDKIKKIIDELN